MSTPTIFNQRPLGAVDPAVLTEEQRQRIVAWDVACRTVGDWEDCGVNDMVCVANFLLDGLSGFQMAYEALYPPLTAEQRADLDRERMTTIMPAPLGFNVTRAGVRPDAMYDPGPVAPS